MSAVRALVSAAHIGPTLAVTTFGVAWGTVVVQLPGATLVVLGAALFAGQLSVGWCNDWVDAPRDIDATRADKPIARGQVSRGAVGLAAASAAVACLVASLLLGVLPGAVHLVAVASAWAYNLVLKVGPASPLPYAVSFALLPAVATTAAAPPAWPHPTVVVAAAALGVAAHFANTVGDTAADAATGVRGLPQRVGARGSMVVMAVLVACAAAVLLAGPGRPGPIGTAALGAGAALAAGAAVWSLRTASGRSAFTITLAAVALVVVGMLASG